ncbi:RNA pyrophosphohydrolase [Rickettsiales endosymbiont of Peranema trichophorum]|uniref:RNA pyrophosphohydrolase n=1 Tax=Rickettsiales endosymbiont of Peranema trichophorum TaxID=2486577 RepID=UPI001023DC0B|nr:RNA pyrophosphohydrolase [Rickettsiales endosymbiont of Peranema trichophorum]RZI47556.1 RNA pyrophosphohydrolase [Rickettsiales endosymbiont of Peranema trichophorum]
MNEGSGKCIEVLGPSSVSSFQSSAPPFQNIPYRKGVGIVLINAQKKVWVGRRIDPPNSWQMPQGGVDEEEIPEYAVFRELLEEIGTNKARIIAVSQKVHLYDFPEHITNLFDGIYRGQQQLWFLMEFLGSDDDIDICASDTPEFQEWKWETSENVVSSIVEFKKQMYDDVFAEFKPLIDRYVV